MDATVESEGIEMGEFTLKLEKVEIEPEDKERALTELRESPETVEAGLKELRQLLADEGLNYPSDKDVDLQVFLRPCKYYAESAFERMRKFYKFKLEHPEYCQDLTPTHVKEAFYSNMFTILPCRNKNGERVLIVEAGEKWDTGTCTVNEIFRSGLLIFEAAISEPKTQISGVRVIVDARGLTYTHFWQFSTSFIMDVSHWMKECAPIRLKGIHIVNQPYLFNIIFSLFQSFLDEKIKTRIHMHGTDFEELHKHICSRILPTEYGGTQKIPLDKGKELHEYLLSFDNEFRGNTFGRFPVSLHAAAVQSI
ncbi:UNVERIFIED_CONTAM: hypothetical protein PYX00_006882 [Menopon gallinae]|uniref:CRAL-TRIO domain-containing protein n=1 Tax=Menopon gallinae TaxID=328185 RepID=A0AAW2HXC6_9NEOP